MKRSPPPPLRQPSQHLPSQRSDLLAGARRVSIHPISVTTSAFRSTVHDTKPENTEDTMYPREPAPAVNEGPDSDTCRDSTCSADHPEAMQQCSVSISVHCRGLNIPSTNVLCPSTNVLCLHAQRDEGSSLRIPHTAQGLVWHMPRLSLP